MKKRLLQILSVAIALCATSTAHASMLEGEALDSAAEVISWIVLVVSPLIAITLFWIVHVMPEKIAEDKGHPQAKAIQVLCLLSLVFGGLLWPIAWLWAYTKPVLYQMAYGTDTVEYHHGKKETPEEATLEEKPSEEKPLEEQVQALRDQLAELNLRFSKPAIAEGKDA